MADVNFNDEAQKILKELQQLLNLEDKATFNDKLQETCNNFDNFYTNYYQNILTAQQELQKHKQQLQQLGEDPEKSSSYIRHKQSVSQSMKTTIVSLANAARQLETLLTGFKAVFLKTLNQDFVQQIVIENEEYEPIIIKLTDLSSMSNFIKSSTSDFQGKLKSNKEMLEFINNNTHGSLYEKIYVVDPYIKVYKESRRRLNIFYDKVKKGQRYGEGLLLYKPNRRWIKFYVSNLGDLKQGYVSMVSEQTPLTAKIEHDIEIFTKYIGRVDNLRGTLLQDIQTISSQISVKSGSAQTGSHEELIELIREIKNGNFKKIEEIFNRDVINTQNEVGQRNRVYSHKESKNKVATMLAKVSQKKAEEAVEFSLQDLQSAGNILVKVQRLI